jgi:glycosyltransferase involved in cell wall biosynthesis
MACGTPVVAFDNTATSEVVGDGGTLVPDGDVEAFAKAVVVLLESGDRRDEAAGRALDRAKSFDWDVSIARHTEIYRELARG